jgi:hypothetical protein
MTLRNGLLSLAVLSGRRRDHLRLVHIHSKSFA